MVLIVNLIDTFLMRIDRNQAMISALSIEIPFPKERFSFSFFSFQAQQTLISPFAPIPTSFSYPLDLAACTGMTLGIEAPLAGERISSFNR